MEVVIEKFLQEFSQRQENLESGSSERKSPTTREPPSKRMKCAPSGGDDDLDDEELEFVGDLAEEWRKDKKERNMATVKSLFDQTANRRRQWIINDRPLLSEVYDALPCYSSSRLVSFHDTMLTTSR